MCITNVYTSFDIKHKTFMLILLIIITAIDFEYLAPITAIVYATFFLN